MEVFGKGACPQVQDRLKWYSPLEVWHSPLQFPALDQVGVAKALQLQLEEVLPGAARLPEAKAPTPLPFLQPQVVKRLYAV